MKLFGQGALSLCLCLLACNVQSHVSITSGPATAGSRALISIGVPHGCEAEDSVRVEVELPESFASVRPMDGVFGQATVEKNAQGGVTKLIWTKPLSARLEEDDHYYEFSFRATMPDAPFVTVALPTTQYCLTDEGSELSVSWNELPVDGGHDSHGASGHPAPTLMLLPERFKGWNQFTAPDHIHDMSIFNDAEIVWKNDVEAYSANPVIQQMIENDSNTGVLSQIHPGEVFWVKY